MENIKNVVEALIFSAGAPIAKKELIEKVPELTGSKLDQAVKELKKKYGGESGVLLLEFNGKLQFSSSPAYGDIVAEALKPLRERQLSRTLLEVLATVAYRQPVTRLELEEMRGKSDGTTTSCEYAISGLLKAGLIEVVQGDLRAGQRHALPHPHRLRRGGQPGRGGERDRRGRARGGRRGDPRVPRGREDRSLRVKSRIISREAATLSVWRFCLSRWASASSCSYSPFRSPWR